MAVDVAPEGTTRARSVAILAGYSLACLAALVGVYVLFVLTVRGQQVEDAALFGARIGRARLLPAVQRVLDLISVVSLLGTTAALGGVAVLRRRFGFAALIVVLVVVTNAGAQVLKATLLRPDFGIDPAGTRGENTFPSGHTTVAMSVATAFVVALPTRLRNLGAWLAAGYASLTGVATLSAGWHRPSDAVGANLLVGGVAALLLVAGAARPSRRAENEAREDLPRRVAGPLLLTSGLGLVAVSALAGYRTAGVVRDVTAKDIADSLSRPDLLVAYAGGAAAIAGSAVLVLALVLRALSLRQR